MAKRVLQANLNNQGGAFSVAYEAQKKLEGEFIFDYFSAEKFIDNAIYRDLLRLGSECVGGVECKNRILKQYAVYKALVEYLNVNPHDYVHIHADTAWKMSIYYLAAKKAGVKNIVVHSHSSGIGGHYRKLNCLLHIMCIPIIRKAKFKCACSDIAAKWMFKTEDDVRIIQNGVDIEKYQYREEGRYSIRSQYRIDSGIKVIGTVGDFSYPKNPEFIYELINRFKDNPEYIFLMVGNREPDCKLKELIEKNGDIKNVIFAGLVTNVEEYLSAMDVFILPSRFEGLPMCAVEAQVSGLYTIISDKVTAETKCSVLCNRVKLDVNEWQKEIEKVDLSYDRNAVEEYLFDKKFSSEVTADGFREVYRGC